MKTKIFLLLAASSLLMGATSCSDFLDEDNKTGETAALTYSTTSGINGLMASCYTFARGWYGKEPALGLSEMGTDLFYYGYDNKQKSMLQYNLNSNSLNDNVADNPCLDQYWELFYDAVDVCNNAIAYVPKCAQISAALQNQYLGEAYFLRAFYYFHMVNMWGAVPYNDAPIEAQNTAPVRMPEAEVYGKILSDLDKSISYFETAGYKTKAEGRANYWAARGIKARVLLYAASWLEGQLGKAVAGNDTYSSLDQKGLYAAAQTEAEAVIGSGIASLYPSYNDVWSMNNESAATNKESVFGITYSQDLASTSNCIPYRYGHDGSGNALQYNSLISRTGYSRGGSAMLLMFVSMWNNGATDLGGNGTKGTNVFVRALDASTDTIHSTKTNQPVTVAAAYSPYGRGFTRYLPSLHLWQLLEAHRSTDQRTEATLLTHYDIASADLSKNAKNYKLINDTAIYYCPLDGSSNEGKAMQAHAQNRYRIQFMANGDIPVYTSMDPATALPTEAAKKVSDVYKDTRYNTYKISGWCSYPGIKKFLDNVYNPSYQSYDISSRDAIVMRLSELYLIKAECQLGQGNTAAALSTINALRTVRAIPGKDNTISGTPTIDTILSERAVELCGEQMRWFDLKRTGKLYEYIEKYNAQASTNVKADESSKHFLYRPIPQAQIDAVTNYTGEANSTTGFWQNPGY